MKKKRPLQNRLTLYVFMVWWFRFFDLVVLLKPGVLLHKFTFSGTFLKSVIVFWRIFCNVINSLYYKSAIKKKNIFVIQFTLIYLGSKRAFIKYITFLVKWFWMKVSVSCLMWTYHFSWTKCQRAFSVKIGWGPRLTKLLFGNEQLIFADQKDNSSTGISSPEGGARGMGLDT